MGPRRPHRGRARDDEVLPGILDPPPERGARRPALPVLEPRGTRLEPPQADGVPRPAPRSAERIARRPRPEERDEPPGREEGLARRPPRGDPVRQGATGPRPDRHRLARSARGPREVQRPTAGDLTAHRVAAGPRWIEPP